MRSTEGLVSTADGVRLFVHVEGDGPQMVFIPNGLYLVDEFSRLAKGRTLVFYDVRNRGRSDSIDDPSRLAGGVLNDVADLEALRRHFGAASVNLIGHSYVGLTVILYAASHPDRTGRVVQIGPVQPNQETTYPPELSQADDILRDTLVRIAEMQQERSALDPVAFCRRLWSVLRPLYVADPANAGKVTWDRCDLPNERAFMKYWLEHLLPSMRRLRLTRQDLATVTAPVLTIHGRQDRSAPIGGGRDWVMLLPDARLLVVEGAGHGPWIEAPVQVFGAIETFLGGAWPDASRRLHQRDAL
jgi:proline iminopeptidase